MTPRRVLLVLHQPRSHPGRYGRILRDLGHHLVPCRPCAGDPLPTKMAGVDAAIVFGGPMSANDDATLSFIKTELDWIGGAVASGKPFLGICLGAQMLARVLGGRVFLHPEGKAEIGYFPLRPTAAAGDLFAGLDHVYHWHREGFDLPGGTEVLATGDMFTNQAYRVGRAAYGIQFHGEVTNAMRDRWMHRAAHRLTMPGAQKPPEQIAKQRLHDQKMESWAERFLARWVTAPE